MDSGDHLEDLVLKSFPTLITLLIIKADFTRKLFHTIIETSLYDSVRTPKKTSMRHQLFFSCLDHRHCGRSSHKCDGRRLRPIHLPSSLLAGKQRVVRTRATLTNHYRAEPLI